MPLPHRIRITPHGRLIYEHRPEDDDAPDVAALPRDVAAGIAAAFAEGQAAGIMHLAGLPDAVAVPHDLAFFRGHARRLVTAVGHLAEEGRAAFMRAASRRDLERALPAPDDDALAAAIAAAPPLPGLEYLSAAVLLELWFELAAEIRERAGRTKGGLAATLATIDPALHLLGKVTFHLAENRRDEERPFAFLATYAHRLSATSAVQHLPLAKAVEESADRRDQAKLVELLTPVRAAAERSGIVREWLDSRAIFTPRAITIAEAHRLLRDVPLLEESGLAVRVPDWWRGRRPPRPTVQVRLGDAAPSEIGVDSLLDFSVDIAIDGEPLDEAEIADLLAGTEGLALLRGRWVEVDGDRLREALAHWKRLERAHAAGIDFVKGMRLLAGADFGGAVTAADTSPEWMHVTAGEWLRDTLAAARDPQGRPGCEPGRGLAATLRPYQADGVRWLWLLTRLGLGGCLADDMGLGKTIQMIDLLLRLRDETPAPRRPGSKRPGRAAAGRPSLLVVPASLLGNWKQELARFAPQLKAVFVHRSETEAAVLDRLAADPMARLSGTDLVVTTYALVKKLDWIATVPWRLAVLDEAQAIKNASSAQTKAVKRLRAEARIALTGTPVENQLGDLWSLFDFCCPGLLGSAGEFKAFVKRMGKQADPQGFAPLRRLIQPYILRRLKTDPRIVPDLPAKTEMRSECGLSRKQAALYQQTVDDLQKQLRRFRDGAGGSDIRRRGVVLATTMRLKQICNHPAQFLGLEDAAAYAAAESGKFLRLAELCEPIRARQEKALVFTQFQTLCEPLAGWLGDVFGRPGLVLHGGVPVGRRQGLVKRFQEDDAVPFFVISVKAGGTGLNLTAASHVIHFDRWWNPAVENQATDRAFRIGQKRNVIVHAFVCRGTLEERIDDMLRQKRDLAERLLGPAAAGETLLTEMNDEELLRVVALDVSRAAVD
ncbi:MAG: DEAD/DEAH box helicase [Planctomycetaceae bacterium]